MQKFSQCERDSLLSGWQIFSRYDRIKLRKDLHTPHLLTKGSKMEKKTIGKFISALRRVNGMTQKELGDKLFVSDKTVSRWERDECLPELSLIPAIAEIFGITTDELLRGQRNSSENDGSTPSEWQKEKGEKQFKMMLHKNEKKFSNLSLISIGLTVLGIITAMICNGFYKSLLGGLLGLAFFIAAAICQICFTNAFSLTNYEDEHEDAIKVANTKNAEKTIRIIFLTICATLFCLPLIILGSTNYGLVFVDTWLPYGLAMTLIGFIICFCIYKLFVLPALIKNESICLSEEDTANVENSRNLIKRISKISLMILASALVLAMINATIEDFNGYVVKHNFESREEMKAFLENQYDEWYYKEYGKTVVKDGKGVPQDVVEIWVTVGGFAVVKDHAYYPMMELTYDRNGRFWYYSNPDLNYITFFNETPGEEAYRVITKEDYYNGKEMADIINICLVGACVGDVTACAGYYIYKSSKKGKE